MCSTYFFYFTPVIGPHNKVSLLKKTTQSYLQIFILMDIISMKNCYWDLKRLIK